MREREQTAAQAPVALPFTSQEPATLPNNLSNSLHIFEDDDEWSSSGQLDEKNGDVNSNESSSEVLPTVSSSDSGRSNELNGSSPTAFTSAVPPRVGTNSVTGATESNDLGTSSLTNSSLDQRRYPRRAHHPPTRYDFVKL